MARRSNRWPEYVSVAQRRRAAASMAKVEAKKGRALLPVHITGRAIATTFWGKAWCQHLEKFSDYSNRLPRGRTYARNGSVIHLEIDTGSIKAMVSGSYTYHISIAIKPLPDKKWQALKAQCAGGIDSALELLQGKLSNNVMQTMCDKDNGLFPKPAEIQLNCDCPDWAALCKHLAAVLYGVGARLDQSPELLFVLRGIDYQELISADLAIDTSATVVQLDDNDLSAIFGIEFDTAPDLDTKPANATAVAAGKRKKRSVKTTASKPIHASAINISRGIRASHLLKLRKLHRLSQQDLAKLTGKSIVTIRNWEAGKGVLNLQAKSRQLLESLFQMAPAEIARAVRRMDQ